MGAHYGLTIVVAFPKGIVEEPGVFKRLGWWIDDNKGGTAGIGALVILVAFLWWRWNLVGRDPRAGPKFPRYVAPPGMGPAAVRFINRMRYDAKCMAAGLVGLGARGFLKIREAEDAYLLERTGKELGEWLPGERTLLAGDLVEFDATPYAGDAYFQDWPRTLDAIAALKPLALVPGRGPALEGEAQVREGLAVTRAFVSELYASVKAGADAGRDLKTVYRETVERLRPTYGHWVIFDHCMPFDVTRAYDEATQYPDPRVWTAERDRQMWETLEG
jgi:hypothetical protein